jgi:nitrite reductase/ring-hydroxylating ferredoxin subunit
MERIFGKTWIFLGMDSEVPNAGDYMVRQMGADQVIVSRARDGEIYVSLNVCPHRGMRVCTSEQGNQHVHTCIYHGWAFRPNGDFVGTPIAEEKMHGEMLPKEKLGLRKARVHIYGGLIFATWNIDGPSFEEGYLGEMKWYYDMLFCRTDGGLEALGPPQRFTIRANWKTAGEQSAADGFHTLTLHRWLGAFAKNNDLTNSMYGVDVGSLKGHALRCTPVAQKFKIAEGFVLGNMTLEEKLEVLAPPGITKAMLPELMKNLSPEQLNLLIDQPPQVGGMFPNVMVAFVYIPQPDGSVLGLTALHAYVPKGPYELEFMNWILCERDAPEDFKARALQATIRQLGTSGMIEQDDSDTWPHMTQMAKGPQGRTMTMKYQAMCSEPPPANWPGPGLIYSGFTKDDTQWNWWLRYRELMTATV